MQLKHLSVAAFIGLASAQGPAQNLTAALTSSNQTSALVGLLNTFNLTSTLAGQRNITILAPSNDAINAFVNTTVGSGLANNPDLARAVLTYHVLKGTIPASAITNASAFVPTLLTAEQFTQVTGGQVVQAQASNGGVTFFSGLGRNSSVVQADINFDGGVIHIINSVLTLPANVTTTAVTAGLSSLAGAVVKAGLANAVDTARDVTIFAPSNDAFSRIASAANNLSNEALGGLLQYHVVAGTVGYSSLLTDGQTLHTLSNGTLTVRIQGQNVFVNNALVVTPNVLVANGVVHVIDNVLNPANATAAPAPSATAGAPAFEGATSATEPPFASNAPTAPAGETPGPGAAPTTPSAAAMPMRTAAVGAAALFGAGVALFNY